MTAEVAVTLPVVVLALAVVLFAGSVARGGVTCADAARAAGRALARGEAAGGAAAEAQRVAGRPVQVEVAGGGAALPSVGGAPAGGSVVVVTVRLDVRPGLVPASGDASGWRVPVTCSARAWSEPVA